ncbi:MULTISPECIES: LysR substrate-binding domain-containing protein [Vibrio]|uniref:LysR substrate-binding domain-containing protein n=1 Tax=Vibrio TaxID=662 RepID=UPI0001B939A5|nr:MULTISPECIES: LysR family transcriptional regulator [Vibrio]EEX32918.1 transcriptional regulator LysR family [Vibrio coralliilyticus ATCC BAA-450]MCM5507577.1 LysR family transcriptional regulator [Vibrio sp. SCSIO 43169]MDE3899537.1 LysR family transcriptional regulator [Vibrio sp. CC007]QFT38780.1 Glycine cleavage system transcriptional activator [Vibrio sp. THAF64]QGM36682.1 Glycine cleavage system transcriptional activator [Vibrio sp. THAF191d]
MLKGSELPSIKALRSFIAVAHHQSFSKAAEELYVTQGAVSKQIAILEQMVGQPLLERQLNGIELTTAGKQYLPKVIEALEIIQHATASLIQSDTQQELLTIDVTPSFASLWLLPKIEEFRRLHPQLQVKIRTRENTQLKLAGESDIALRCLPLSQHYEHSQLLCQEKLLLIGEQSATCSDVNSVLTQHALIPHTTRPQLWELFKLEHQCAESLNYYGVGYEHFYLSLEAVKRGKGLALVPDFMASEMLEKALVSNLLGLSMLSGYGYYLSVPNYRLASRKVQLFHQWLRDELEESK